MSNKRSRKFTDFSIEAILGLKDEAADRKRFSKEQVRHLESKQNYLSQSELKTMASKCGPTELKTNMKSIVVGSRVLACGTLYCIYYMSGPNQPVGR